MVQVTDQMVEDYQRDGVVLIKGLWADWVDEIAAGIARNMAEPGPYASENLKPGEAGRFLFEKGFYVQSVTFPAVPYHAGVLRIQINANHEPAAIDGLLGALAALQRKFALPGAEPLRKAA